MLLPSAVDRSEIDRQLAHYFESHRIASFNRAIGAMCRFYGVRRPRIEWFEYIDWGKTAGRTFEDGRIHLVHPSIWKRGRVFFSQRRWVQMIYHEMGHYILWTDAERKADLFARRMVAGLKSVAHKRRRTRVGVPSSRRSSTRAKIRTRIGRRAPHRRSRAVRVRSRKMRAVS
jgi:hypothetical protein